MMAIELLGWAKGSFFTIALSVFIIGVMVRLLEILALARAPAHSVARGNGFLQGIRTVFSRLWPAEETLARSPVTIIGGYVFHLGFFFVLLAFTPHIQLFKAIFGVSWPGLSVALVDAVTLITLLAMLAVLMTRLLDPVRRMLTHFDDGLAWTLTFLPMLTGYMLVNRIAFSYEMNLALHVLSVDLLLLVFPFTNLMHAATLVLSRYYNGAIAGRKGAHS